jgi:hypothetical protein
MYKCTLDPLPVSALSRHLELRLRQPVKVLRLAVSRRIDDDIDDAGTIGQYDRVLHGLL